VLSEFARTCKAAARAVSLYPSEHPVVVAALARAVASGHRLTREGPVTLGVQPDLLTMDGRAPARPDAAIAEFAALLHERLIGVLTIRPGIDLDDWRAFLPLLAASAADLHAAGGVAQAASRAGSSHLEIREIDYADVLRERGGRHADWDRIVESCLHGETDALDDRAMAALLDALEDPARFALLLERLEIGDLTEVNVRVAALLKLMRAAIDAARARGVAEGERAIATVAASCAVLTPEVMLALIDQRRSGDSAGGATAGAVLSRMTDEAKGAFAVRSVAVDQGASERLARALDVLAPSAEQKKAVLESAGEQARRREQDGDEGFERIWQNAAGALVSHWLSSYSDSAFVSEQYGRELSTAGAPEVQTRRVPDDPPERVQAWAATVSGPALDELDRRLLIDLLRLEDDPERWGAMAGVAASEATRRLEAGDVTAAASLVEAIAGEIGASRRLALEGIAVRHVEQLCSGSLARLVAIRCRQADEAQMEALAHLCQRLGPGLVPAMADALARETGTVVVERLATLLLGFGAAGQQTVEQLRLSPNPAVRRAAIRLLRLGGRPEALPELATMLDDRDPEVQRESLRAIVEIGTPAAFAVLERVLQSDAQGPLVRALVGLRGDNAALAFCHLLAISAPGRQLLDAHLSMIEVLGAARMPDSVRTLAQVLHRGSWWAPRRTAALRRAAATALRRLGTTDAVAVLETAAASGPRGVRQAARLQLARPTRQERPA
jgi:HEAT repeat protein